MCGIAGLVGLDSSRSKELVSLMSDVIAYRGPDGAGIFVEKNVALAHRRLAIVDLSDAGHQPMHYLDRYVITYNGEIYNHVEIRAELVGAGYQFHSHTDTEVIVAAYDYWGEECLQRFNGMWAFALYDRHQDTLFLARDRFGVKPFYYWRSPEGFLAFASEIKQFTVLPGWLPKLNGQRAYDFLNWGLLDHTEQTLFSEVFQLRGGQCALIELRKQSNFEKKNWYVLEPAEFSGSMEDAAGQFAQLFEDAVRLRLRADVAVGSCLSGGLDSSSIVCVMNRLLKEKDASGLQKTFSACAEVKKYDERDYIDEVTSKTEVDAHYVYPSLEDLFGTLSDLTWHQDEPFGSTSIYAQWHVFKLARENDVTVMLDGQGADEQLAGYHSFFAPRFTKLFTSLQWVKLWHELVQVREIHGYPIKYSAMHIGNMLMPEVIRGLAKKFLGRETSRPDWLNVDLINAQPINPMTEAGTKTSSIRKLSYSQLTASNLQMLLHWEDRNSMAHSIESRVPFLDYRLVEFVLGLPDDFKLSNGVTKRVLREAMRGVLPEMIRTRMDKLGFVTPEEVWIKEKQPAFFREALQKAVDQSRGVLTEKTLHLFEDMLDGKQSFSFIIWRFISFGAWMERFKVSL